MLLPTAQVVELRYQKVVPSKHRVPVPRLPLRRLLPQPHQHQRLHQQRQHLLQQPLQFQLKACQKAGPWSNGKSTAKCGWSKTEGLEVDFNPIVAQA